MSCESSHTPKMEQGSGQTQLHFAELYTWDRSGCLIYGVRASSPKLWVNQLILPIKGASKEEAHYETSAALAKESGWSESNECLTTGPNQHLL